jgi:5'(3')-deoxyribonucleotidase
MPQLFLDCDGVLADFDGYCESVMGFKSRAYEAEFGSNAFWKRVNAHPNFYLNLPLMKDAMELYNAVKHLNPIVITGCPAHSVHANDKLAWRDKYFPQLEMICTPSVNKRDYAKPGDIIIDDSLKYRHYWEEMGGIWIPHTSAKDSLEQLWKVLGK